MSKGLVSLAATETRVFQQLLRYADDAGATAVHFVVDSASKDTIRDRKAALLVRLTIAYTSENTNHAYSTINWLPDEVFPGSTVITEDPPIVSASNEVVATQSTDLKVKRTARKENSPLYDTTLCDSRLVSGCTIHIPLRAGSRFSFDTELSLTLDEILKNLQNFKNELPACLIFLNNVLCVTLSLSEEGVLAKAEFAPGSSGCKAALKDAFSEVYERKNADSADAHFYAEICYSDKKSSRTYHWWISHHLRRSLFYEGEDLTQWAQEHLLLPWAGVAALTSISGDSDYGSSSFAGCMFNRVPLGVAIDHPVHIHGSWSTPWKIDFLEDRKDNPTSLLLTKGRKWDRVVYDDLITRAWANLLMAIGSVTSSSFSSEGKEDPLYHYWPAASGSHSYRIMQFIVERSLPVWPTVQGRKTSSQVYFACQMHQRLRSMLHKKHFARLDRLRSALHEIQMPICYVPGEIFGLLETYLPLAKIVTPTTVATYVRCYFNAKGTATAQTRESLLDYLSSQSSEKLSSLVGLPLFPISGGSWAALGYLSTLRLPTETELQLFSRQRDRIIDTSALPAKILDRLRSSGPIVGLQLGWNISDVSDYCKATYFASVTVDNYDIEDTSVPAGFKAFLRPFWAWLICNHRFQDIMESLGDMWIIPLRCGKFRKLGLTSPKIICTKSEGIGKFLGSTTEFVQNCPLYDSDSLGALTTNTLTEQEVLGDCDDLVTLLQWLSESSTVVASLSTVERMDLIEHLGVVATSFSASKQITPQMRTMICRLQIFREIRNSTDGTVLNWTTVDNDKTTYVGIKPTNVVPETDNVTFLEISQDAIRSVLKIFNLADLPGVEQYLRKYVISGLIETKAKAAIIERLGAYALDNHRHLSDDTMNVLGNTSFVPVSTAKRTLKKLLPPKLCISPESELKGLYLDSECIWVAEEYLQKYRDILYSMGMIQKITADIVIDRVTAYAAVALDFDVEEIAVKARRLIALTTSMSIPAARIISEGRWIPARDPRGEVSLMNASMCRDESYRSVVGHVLGIADMDVPANWKLLFNWSDTISVDVICQQVMAITERKDLIALERLLQYTSHKDGYAEPLKVLKWVPGVSGHYYLPQDVFFGDFGLIPWCDQLEKQISHFRLFLEKAGVSSQPSFLKLQDISLAICLECDGLVIGDMLEKCLHVFLQAVDLYPGESLASFKVPDYRGVLFSLSELTAGEPWLCINKDFGDIEPINFLHPRIPLRIVETLAIPRLTARRVTVSPEPSIDPAKDANAIDHRLNYIRNVLSAYCPEDIFHKFLSFAESVPTARAVEWILDLGSQTVQSVSVGPKFLGIETSGPRLFFIFDAVLQDNDLEQLVESVSGNNGGRYPDLLTMCFWTNLPQVVSGNTFILFDLEQRYIPIELRTEKQPGVLRVDISKLQKLSNQLSPFYGIRGLTAETQYLRGTAFMFPLCKSDRLPLSPFPTNVITWDMAKTMLLAYRAEAHMSLLFLSRIMSLQLSLGGRAQSWQAVKHAQIRETVDGDFAIDSLLIDVATRCEDGRLALSVDRWLVCYQVLCDVENETTNISRSISTSTELIYKTAALVNSGGHAGPSGKIFDPLPSRLSTGLPVQILMPSKDLIQADNATVRFDSGPHLVGTYFHLLSYMATCLGGTSYSYWPVTEPTSHSFGLFVYNVFWGNIEKTGLKLLPSPRLVNSCVIEEMSQCLKFEQAVFDLLTDAQSSILQPLWLLLGFENIIKPPAAIKALIEQISSDKIRKLTPSMLRESLRIKCGADALAKYWKEAGYTCEGLCGILDFVLSGTEWPRDITECAVIPLMDRTFGTLGSRVTYYISAPEQRDMFEYSPGLLLHCGLSETTYKAFLNLGLNVVRFQFAHIPQLFSGLGNVDHTSEHYHLFLRKFWAMIWRSFEGKAKYDHNLLLNLPVYSASIGENIEALTPHEFENKPAVLRPPRDTPEMVVFRKTPGLYLVSATTFPISSARNENLRAPCGFVRYIRALSKLSFKAHKTVDVFASTVLDDKDLLYLKECFVYIMYLPNVIRQYSEFKTILQIVRQLRLWSTASGKLVNANDAVFVSHSAMYLPWLECSEKMVISTTVAADSALRALEVATLDLATFVHQHFLPSLQHRVLVDHEVMAYGHFLSSLLQSKPDALERCPAIDGCGQFRRVQDLYDHRHPVFQAAFRNREDTHFLHKCLRNLGHWTYENGMRNTVSPQAFIACAKAIQARGLGGSQEDVSLERADAKTVYEYLLLTWRNMELDRSFWQQLSTICFIPIQQDFSGQPRFRSSRMVALSKKKGLSSPMNCISLAFACFCWSQCVFFEQQPSEEMLHHIPAKGYPNVKVVLDHLRYLSQNWNSSINMAEYVADVASTYEYLDKTLEKEYLTLSFTEEKLWCNLSKEDLDTLTKEHFRESWVCSKELCLGIHHDSGSYRPVKSLLAAYPKLLKTLDVQEVTALVSTDSKDVDEPMHIPFIGVERLWQHDKFCDIELSFGGKTFKCHRLVLASASPYWERMFTGPKERKSGSLDFGSRNYSDATISGLLQYIYSGKLPIPEQGSVGEVQLLLDWLVLSYSWEMPVLRKYLEKTIMHGGYIDPGNVKTVLQVAREAKATSLLQMCVEYVEVNLSLVERIDGSFRMKG